MLILFSFSACGGSMADRTNKALGTAIVATDAARDQFVQWDKQHQIDIVDKATTREQAELGLMEYRERRQRIIQAFTIAYSSMATAAATIPLVQAGKKSDRDLAKMLIDAIAAVETVMTSLQEIRDAFDAKESAPSTPTRPTNPKPADPAVAAPGAA
jgi:hypothetical protein